MEEGNIIRMGKMFLNQIEGKTGIQNVSNLRGVLGKPATLIILKSREEMRRLKKKKKE